MRRNKMNNNTILIKIESGVNSGKTTIGKLIEIMLKENRLNVEFTGHVNPKLNYVDIFDKLNWSNKKIIIMEESN